MNTTKRLVKTPRIYPIAPALAACAALLCLLAGVQTAAASVVESETVAGDYAGLKAQAEAYYAQHSYALARDAYLLATNLAPSAPERRWTSFRIADTRWRAQAGSKTADATARTVRRKKSPPHTGHIEAGAYALEDGGPRIMRSVVYMRSCHGRAIHPTEKPVDLLDILIRTSCPPGGIVGDLFAGSGAVGEAARGAGRNYIGCEIDAGMAAKGRSRLSEKLDLVKP